MPIKRSIIFDLDGTLVDSLPGIQSSILYAIRERGHALDGDVDIKSLIGPPMREVFARLLAPFGDRSILSGWPFRQ